MTTLHRPTVLLAVAWTLLVALAADAAAGETVNLRLESVEVLRQRERGGDRPYFATLQFRSRLNTRGSTEVRIVEFEPHDWVSKPAYRAGLGRGDHVQAGQRANIPWWMGELQWRGVDIVDGRSGDLSAAVNAEILGAIVFSLDNNNTPPHVIRGLLRKGQQIVQEVLVDQVERGRGLGPVVSGDMARLQRAITAKADEVARRIVSGFDVARLLFQFTVGSTFSPDQPTGIHVVLLPAITGFPVTDRSQPFDGLPGGPVTARLLVAPPVDRREAWTFEGSGARYRVQARIDRDTHPGSTPVPRLRVRLRTGNDDLRRGSRVEAEVQLRDGRRIASTVLTGQVATRDGGREVPLTLPAGTRLDDVATFRLRFHADGGGAFESPDDWKLDAVQVLYGEGAGERLLVATGSSRELQRFTQRNSTWEVSFERRGLLRLPVPPLRVQPVPIDAFPRRR